jgi:hypothetical protein
MGTIELLLPQEEFFFFRTARDDQFILLSSIGKRISFYRMHMHLAIPEQLLYLMVASIFVHSLEGKAGLPWTTGNFRIFFCVLFLAHVGASANVPET